MISTISIHLSLGEVEGHCNLVPPEPGQVVTVHELPLQLRDLVPGEGSPLLPGIVVVWSNIFSFSTDVKYFLSNEHCLAAYTRKYLRENILCLLQKYLASLTVVLAGQDGCGLPLLDLVLAGHPAGGQLQGQAAGGQAPPQLVRSCCRILIYILFHLHSSSLRCTILKPHQCRWRGRPRPRCPGCCCRPACRGSGSRQPRTGRARARWG